MAKTKSRTEKAAGKLISAIQKEWHYELGEPTADLSEVVMNKGHDLLQAAKNNDITSVLSGMSVAQYLGELWVKKHPAVKEFIAKLEREIEASVNV